MGTKQCFYHTISVCCVVALCSTFFFSCSSSSSEPHYSLSYRLGEKALAMGKYTVANQYFEHILKTSGNQNDLEHAETLEKMGLVALRQARFSEAERYYREAERLKEKLFGHDSAALVENWNYQSQVLVAKGDLDKAEQRLSFALKTVKSVVDENHIALRATLNNLGHLYRLKKDYKNSADYFNQSFAILESNLGPGHPDLSEPLLNLSQLYFALGKYDDGEFAVRRALGLKENVIYKGHPDLIPYIKTLAAIYYKKKNYEASEQYYKQLLSMQKMLDTLPVDDEYLTRQNMGLVYLESKQYLLSTEVFNSLLMDVKKQYGEVSSQTAEVLHYLARVYDAQEKYTQAEEFYKKALFVSEDALGYEHPFTQEIEANYVLSKKKALSPYYKRFDQ